MKPQISHRQLKLLAPKIVAIGGGELRKLQTLRIDRRIVELTGRARPRALFIPTASQDSENYIATFRRVYGDKLGCKIQIFLLIETST